MKLSSIYLLAATAAAAAATTTCNFRGAASITTSLVLVRDDIAGLTAAGNAFDGDTAPAVAASDKLAATVAAATAAAAASAELSVGDALALAPVLRGIRDNTRALADAVAAKVPRLERAAACALCRAHLLRLAAAAAQLIDEVAGKLPAPARGAAKAETDRVREFMAEAVAAVAPDRCRDGGL